MGYNTDFEGVLKFKTKPTVEELERLNEIMGEEVPGASYCQFMITKKFDGIEWDRSEKFYDAEKAAQYVIDYMREKFPAFGLVGDLQAQGESIEDRWILRCTGDKAEKIDSTPMGERIKCPYCREEFFWDGKK